MICTILHLVENPIGFRTFPLDAIASTRTANGSRTLLAIEYSLKIDPPVAK